MKPMVFDEPGVANFQKYSAGLENTRTRPELFRVGPREKEEFLHLHTGNLA